MLSAFCSELKGIDVLKMGLNVAVEIIKFQLTIRQYFFPALLKEM